MSCPEVISEHLVKKLTKYKTSVELCCALGMTAIELAKKLDYVYGIDIDKERIVSAKKNAQLYGVQNKTEFIQGNVLGKCEIENIIWDNRVRFKYAFFADDIIENKETDVYFSI